MLIKDNSHQLVDLCSQSDLALCLGVLTWHAWWSGPWAGWLSSCYPEADVCWAWRWSGRERCGWTPAAVDHQQCCPCLSAQKSSPCLAAAAWSASSSGIPALPRFAGCTGSVERAQERLGGCLLTYIHTKRTYPPCHLQHTHTHTDKSSTAQREAPISSNTSSHVRQCHTCPLVHIQYFFLHFKLAFLSNCPITMEWELI